MFDKITYSQYKIAKTGTKKIINLNTSTVTNQHRKVKISSEVELNLSKLGLTFSNDGIKHRFGNDVWSISFGFTMSKGLTTSISSNGYEYGASFRPGGYAVGAGLIIGAAIIYPPSLEFTIPPSRN